MLGELGHLYLCFNKACTYNTSKSDEYRRHCKKYTLYISYYSGSIDIPPEVDVNPLPNLGKKKFFLNKLNMKSFS